MKICKFCSKQFAENDYRQQFCNRTCSAKFNNKGVRRHGKSPGNCKFCGSKLQHSQNKFCNKTCFNKSVKEKSDDLIEKGLKHSPNTLRRYLKNTRQHKCEICNGMEWFGKPMPLVMDHIDGNPANDLPANLRWICPNCDRFLPTFGSRNRGFGRKSRGIRRGSNL